MLYQARMFATYLRRWALTQDGEPIVTPASSDALW
jgi:streptomycin 6-kinase